MSLFRRNQSTYDNSDTIAGNDSGISDAVQTEIEEKRYEGDLFDETMKIVTSPDNKYLTNIQNGNIEKEEFLEIIKRQLEKFTSDEDQIKDSLERLDKWIWGYYIIEDFLNDETSHQLLYSLIELNNSYNDLDLDNPKKLKEIIIHLITIKTALSGTYIQTIKENIDLVQTLISSQNKNIFKLILMTLNDYEQTKNKHKVISLNRNTK